MTPAQAGSVRGPEGSNTSACGGGGGGGGGTSPRPPEQGLKCPRCDSYNTKFCYYNNYSLTQPRHFCKSCRRYWTKGGALRNVPFGGGSRKTRKSRSMASLSSSTASFRLSADLHGRAMQEPSFFQLGGYNAYSPVCGTSGGVASQVLSFGGISSSTTVGASAAPLVVLDCPAPAVSFFNEMGCRGETATTTSEESMGSIHRNLATSIESLSSINQDLHWKLQQQRLAMFFGGEGHHPTKEGTGGAAVLNAWSRHHPPPSLLFSSSRELSAGGARGGGATGYFLENSTHNTATVDDNSFAANDWTGTPTWSDVHPFGALR